MVDISSIKDILNFDYSIKFDLLNFDLHDILDQLGISIFSSFHELPDQSQNIHKHYTSIYADWGNPPHCCFPEAISEIAINPNPIVIHLYYKFYSRPSFHSWLKNLIIQDTKSKPDEIDLISLLILLIDSNWEDLVELVVEKYQAEYLLLKKIPIISSTTEVTFLDLSWSADSHRVFTKLKNYYQTNSFQQYQQFMNQILGIEHSSPLLKTLQKKAILRKIKNKKCQRIYNNFIIDEILPYIKNKNENENKDKDKDNLHQLNQHYNSYFNVARYGILTYSYPIIEIILTKAITEYMSLPRIDFEDIDNFKPSRTNLKHHLGSEDDFPRGMGCQLIELSLEIILKNHCPAIWKKLLQLWQKHAHDYRDWAVLVDKLTVNYFDATNDRGERPSDWRSAYISYFKHLFDYCPSDFLGDLLKYQYDGPDYDRIDLDEFLTGLPSAEGILRKLPIDWSVRKPYLINAYRYSNRSTINWIWSKVKDFDPVLISNQKLVSIGLNYDSADFDDIDFNPILASLINPNKAVLKACLENHQNGDFDSYTDGNRDWYDSSDSIMRILFQARTIKPKYSFQKLDLIKEQIPGFDYEDLSEYIKWYLGLCMNSFGYQDLEAYDKLLNNEQLLERIEKLIQLTGFNPEHHSYARVYYLLIQKLQGNYFLANSHSFIFSPKLIKFFLDHPLSHPESLTIQERDLIWKIFIFKGRVCAEDNPSFVLLNQLLPIDSKTHRDQYSFEMENLAYTDQYLLNDYLMNNVLYWGSWASKQPYLVYFKQHFYYNDGPICARCNKSEYDCFVWKFELIEKAKLWKIGKSSYFTEWMQRMKNRKIVQFLLMQFFETSLNDYKPVTQHCPYPPDLVDWIQMIFTLRRFCIRRRIYTKKKHSLQFRSTLDMVVYRSPVEDHFKEYYPVLSRGSRLYQCGLVNFYLAMYQESLIDENQDELIRQLYTKFSNLDYKKRVKKRNQEIENHYLDLAMLQESNHHINHHIIKRTRYISKESPIVV